MHPFRTHTCNALGLDHVGETVRLSGWIHRKRDHGNLLFVDLRDHFGITQVVADRSSEHFATLESLPLESVITVTGSVVARTEETVNPTLATGRVELTVAELAVRSTSAQLPFPVNSEQPYPEEMRLKHRYLDLRRERNHWIVRKRSEIVASIRQAMVERGFLEITTADPDRDQPGRRARLRGSGAAASGQVLRPAAGTADVQAAADGGRVRPVFPGRALLPRRGGARADRSPGEFYQLDIEMSFVEQ